MTGVKQDQISFPPFRLDCPEERLYRDEVTIPLRPKSFEVLQYLAERPAKFVTKNEIIEAVWTDTAVTDTVLKVCIREIRAALGDDASSPQFIETWHRRGYRFVGMINQPHKQDDPLPDSQEVPQLTSQAGLADPGAANVVGRDSELTRLQGFLEKAIVGERQIAFITGEPGIGKTTLVDAFLNRISIGRVILIARGQCLEQYGASEAYLPMLEAISRLCRESDREDTLSLLREHAPTLLSQIPWLIRDQDRQVLQRETLGTTRERLLREMAEAIEALSAQKPLVLVIEDLHWSDYSTLDLISYLAHRREPARLMVIGTYRPAEVISSRHPLNAVKRELQAHRQCEELALGFLNEAAVAEYLRARFPSNNFPAVFAHQIHRRTDGNPLFIINLLDFFLSRSLISEHGGQWRLSEASHHVETGIPDNVRQIIDKQIDGLSAEEQHVLKAASVAGVEFSIATVSAALDVDLLEIEELCESLARRHLFLRAAGSESPEDDLASRYGFIHALYQNALYDRIPKARCAHLHQRIGKHVESMLGSRASDMAAELAMHFEKAREYRRAVFYLLRAGENATRRFAHHELVDLARRGLKLIERLGDGPEQVEQELLLQTSLALGLSATQGYGSTEVERAYSRARELCQHSESKLQLFPVLWGLWRFYLIRSDLKAARELAESLLVLAKSAQESVLLVEAHLAAGSTFNNTGDFILSREHFEQAIALYNPGEEQDYLSLYGHDPGVVHRCFYAWALWSLGYPDRAIKTAREGLAIAERLRHPETLCFAYFFTAWTHQLRRESEETLIYAKAAIELAGENGIAQWSAFGASLHGWALTEQGRTDEGISQMRQTLDVYRAIGSEISRPHFLGLLAEAMIKKGKTEEALNALTEALSGAQETGQRYYESELHHLKGRLMLAVGNDTKQAEGCFHQAIEVARRQKALSFELRAVTSLGRLWQENDRSDDARLMLTDTLDSFTEGFDTRDLKEARVLLNELQIV